jgi:hypothetical protein
LLGAGFPTPSGRCEFFSERLAAQGLDGLPDHVPNHEPAGSDHRYPLAMISPPARNFLNSTFVNVQSLRDIEGEPVLEISEADAVARGIATGDVVRVFNDRGSYHCKATVSSRARSGVVNGLGIWWRKLGLNGTNVNEVTSQKLTDLGRAPVFYDCLVEVAGSDGRRREPAEPAGLSVRTQGLAAGKPVAGSRCAAVRNVRSSSLANPAYYWQAINGHLELMRAARPVAEWIADPQTPTPCGSGWR